MKSIKSLWMQRGVFGLSSLSFKKDKSKTETTQDRTSKQTTNTSGTASGKETSTGKQTSTARLLNPEVEKALTDLLISGIGPDGEQVSEGMGEVAALLFQRAQSAETTLRARNSEILDAERLLSERQVAQFTTEAARAAGGSTDSSFVIGTNARQREEQAVRLAGLEADLDKQARETMTNELIAAGNLMATQAATSATETNELVSIAEILKGATQVGEVDSVAETLKSEEFSQTSIQDIVEKLQGITKTKGLSISGTMSEDKGDKLSAFSSIFGG